MNADGRLFLLFEPNIHLEKHGMSHVQQNRIYWQHLQRDLDREDRSLHDGRLVVKALVQKDQSAMALLETNRSQTEHIEMSAQHSHAVARDRLQQFLLIGRQFRSELLRREVLHQQVQTVQNVLIHAVVDEQTSVVVVNVRGELVRAGGDRIAAVGSVLCVLLQHAIHALLHEELRLLLRVRRDHELQKPVNAEQKRVGEMDVADQIVRGFLVSIALPRHQTRALRRIQASALYLKRHDELDELVARHQHAVFGIEQHVIVLIRVLRNGVNAGECLVEKRAERLGQRYHKLLARIEFEDVAEQLR